MGFGRTRRHVSVLIVGIGAVAGCGSSHSTRGATRNETKATAGPAVAGASSTTLGSAPGATTGAGSSGQQSTPTTASAPAATGAATATTGAPGTAPSAPSTKSPTLAYVGGSKTMTCTTYPAYCNPKPGNDLKIAITSRPWKSIRSLCLTFHFTGDLLGAGDTLSWASGGGFIGNAQQQSAHLSCQSPASDPKAVASMLDGKQTFDVWMEYGSVRISSIEVHMTGENS